MSGMQLRAPWCLPTIALVAIGAPAWAQICAVTPSLPAPQSPPASNLPAAYPPPSTNLPAAQVAPGGNLNLMNGLVSYWKLDDASGTSAADSKGSITGTGFNGTWTTGKIGGAANFNGSSDAFFMGSTPVNTYPLSIAAWVKPSAAGGEVATILNHGAGVWNGYTFAFGSNSFTMTSVCANAFNNATGSASPGVWHHVVGVVSSASSRAIYVDGVLAGSNTGTCTPPITPTRLSIGVAYHGSLIDNYLAGLIDEVGVWNRALSASEVATLYHGGSGNPFGNSSCGFSY